MRSPSSLSFRPCPFERLEPRVLLASIAVAGFTDEQVVTGLSNPTAMEFAPDGRLFVTQQGGAIRVIKNGVLLPTPFASFTVDSSGERGLLGIAFDPNFATNGFVYVYNTVPAPTGGSAHNRVTRLTANPANPDVALASATSPLGILDLDNLSTATNHNGGAVHFGLDGKLYVAVGENANGANAQTLNNRLGKILRINADGSIPTDNPYFTNDGVTQARDYIWALGLRNPFTFAVQPGTGQLYINDVGEVTWEEINVGVAGSNYGWNTIEGARTTQTPPANYQDPLFAYRHPTTGSDPTTVGIAIAGGAFYNPTTPTYPVSYQGDYFFADLGKTTAPTGGNWIRKLDAGTGNATLFATGLSSPVDLKVGPDGKLYYLERGNNGRVGRVAAATPAVAGVQINDGKAQRSKITQITVTFTRSVTLDAGAFVLTGRNGAGAGTVVSFTNPAGNPLGASTIWFLTFSGSPIVGGSLADGIYDLRVLADHVHDAAVPAQTLPADFSTAFHRLFSDDDGDGDSDNVDLLSLRTTYLKPNTDPAYVSWWDYDGNGVVDNLDVFQVRSRRSIVFQGY